MSGATTESVLARNTHVAKLRKAPGLDLPSSVVLFEGTPLTVDRIHVMPLEQREVVAQFLFRHFRATGFPYPRYPEPELHKDWAALVQVSPESVWNKEHTLLSTGFTAGSKLFKTFFPHFFECSEPGTKGTLKPSMLEQFDDDDVLLSVIRNRLGITFIYRGVHFPFNMSGDMLRQGMRSMRLAPTTTNFRASAAKAIYNRFLPENGITYDFSIGFGQRMLGFLADGRGALYLGVDPWEKQVSAAQELHGFVGKGYNGSCIVDLHRGGSESFCPPEWHGAVDLAFSSPPYYAAEVYDTARSGQAYAQRSYEKFMSDYWTPTVRNVHTLLRPGGRMVLNVAELYRKRTLKKDMVDTCLMLGFEVEGELGMSLAKSHLSGKVGTGKNMKSEPVVVLKRL